MDFDNDDDVWLSEVDLQPQASSSKFSSKPASRLKTQGIRMRSSSPLSALSQVKTHAIDIVNDPLYEITDIVQYGSPNKDNDDVLGDIANQEDEYKKGDDLTSSDVPSFHNVFQKDIINKDTLPNNINRENQDVSTENTLNKSPSQGEQKNKSEAVDALGGDIGLQLAIKKKQQQMEQQMKLGQAKLAQPYGHDTNDALQTPTSASHTPMLSSKKAFPGLGLPSTSSSPTSYNRPWLSSSVSVTSNGSPAESKPKKKSFSSRFSWIRRASYMSSSFSSQESEPSFASTIRDDSYISLNAQAFGSHESQVEVDWLESSPHSKHGRSNESNSQHDSENDPFPINAPADIDEQTRASLVRKAHQIAQCLASDPVDITRLRKLAWSGIPSPALRPPVWKFLLNYLPAASSERVSTLAKKRQEYADAVRVTFSKGKEALDPTIWHQISIDVPRTSPGIPLWQKEATQRALERILYLWAIRHPASGYVQGINDLATPFFQVFISAYIDGDAQTFDPALLSPIVLQAVEADTFWCLSILLEGIQDNYTFAQPGIQRNVARLRELTGRVDAQLASHFEEQHVEFLQFAFRWFNCLLMRELSTTDIIRLWDTYIAEGTDSFSHFHLYVCLAFLMRWSEQLKEMDFQTIIMFLQSPPTQDWSESQTELLVSEAFMWKTLFHDAQSHFSNQSARISDNFDL